MRYRALTASGDYSFGHGQGDLLINTPNAVAQAIQTRLLLFTGEWFLDTTDGTPWSTQILGNNTQATRDLAIKARILRTPGVKSLVSYASQVENRAFSAEAVVDTIYGQASVAVAI